MKIEYDRARCRGLRGKHHIIDEIARGVQILSTSETLIRLADQDHADCWSEASSTLHKFRSIWGFVEVAVGVRVLVNYTMLRNIH